MRFDSQLSNKQQREVIKNTQTYAEKFCKNCKWDYFCCTLSVKLSWLDRMRIRLAGHRIKNVADKHPKFGWVTRIENGNCIFLKRTDDGKAHCSIYKRRPRECRIFPHFYDQDINCGDIVDQHSYKKIGNQEFVEIRFK